MGIPRARCSIVVRQWFTSGPNAPQRDPEVVANWRRCAPRRHGSWFSSGLLELAQPQSIERGDKVAQGLLRRGSDIAPRGSEVVTT
eukprot:7170309-Pyramimonas_sp.AAC.1